ncbi:3-alpha,7-alpha,12-alpha-trihydroxy-5-beta-cholest-24-enoyl-CoA hydratase [Achromobacter sp. RTa]|uniref:MaoC/PaaZ C-terminal domain-containing protein n=1 Tax=Achromobacter sp. RTa TaxID=1532557 RepID=UPI0005100ABF|nr:MaoC/PaaZ C-terminal domain-containing protein [Achromobacter sp. RTa]KGE01516.1 3-alpha,7-alpha,12-alpha-trihydroxy-5-beta-cholest-24-enoyl-CoA hydratase [Achromobacter sp. RTa]
MRLSHEQLLNYELPEVRQQYTARDTMLYALSVGLGQDPLDLHDLAYVGRQHDPQALPWMAVVLGYPGFWLKAPEIGADTVRLLHGEQGMELFHPLPPAGELIGKTRVVEVVDKGEKGLLLYSEKSLTEADSGRLIARTSATHVLRGDGGMPGAGRQARPAHAMPACAPHWSVLLNTRPEQALIYRLNGDYNPLHSDPEVARAAGFPRPILHGMCTFGMVAHAVSRQLLPDAGGSLRSLSLRFSGPVFPGETLQVEVWRDGSFRARVVERETVVIDNGLMRVG